MANKLIVITGLDGSGTTTLAQQLTQIDPKGYLISTPSSPYKECRKQIDQIVLKDSIPAHYYFYLSSVIHASTQIELLRKQYNIYCVRYLIDTVVSHRVAGMDVELEYITPHYQILKPDVTLFIKIDEVIREQRILQRGKDFLDKVLDCENTRKRFLCEFNKLENNYQIVDNSGDIKNCVSNAYRILQDAGVYND